HVGGFAVDSGLVSRLVEQAGQALGIVRVHLAPVGADLVGAAACCHTTRIGADPGTQDSAAEPAIDCRRHKSGKSVTECRVISVAESGMMSVCERLRKRHLMANGALPSMVPTWRASRSAWRFRSSTRPWCGGRSRGQRKAGGWPSGARGRTG